MKRVTVPTVGQLRTNLGELDVGGSAHHIPGRASDAQQSLIGGHRGPQARGIPAGAAR